MDTSVARQALSKQLGYAQRGFGPWVAGNHLPDETSQSLVETHNQGERDG